MKEQNWNEGWKFFEDKDSFALVWNIPEGARDVTLPHDAMIEVPADPASPNMGNTGFRSGGVYTYVKMLSAPEEYRDKTVMLKFEGVYMNAMVFVNEQLAAKRPYGYSGFYVKLNDFLRYGQDNEVRVQVRNNAMTNSRWYSGSGIYRDVYLLVSDTVYIEPDGVQVDTESLDVDLAVLSVGTEIKSRRYDTADLRLETTIVGPDGQTAARDTAALTLLENGNRRITQRITVPEPKAWSEETPYLYTCVSRLYQGDELLDESETAFGIRKLELDAKRGLRVNGEPIKLRGACIHHDSGLLGAATYAAAEYRRVKRLKEAGFNAIRMSHHPAAPVLLRACDELGVYVMDELSDIWTRCKSDNDYALFFDKWWEEDTEAMVRKDYNHPSVILYSLGNEIPEIGSELGAEICDRIERKVKSIDHTRYTLTSINGMFAAGDYVGQIVADLLAEDDDDVEIAEGANVNDIMTIMDTRMDQLVCHPILSERLERACAVTDIAGYNYMTARYEQDGEDYPNRVIVGSETYPPEIPRNWDLVKKLPYVIGDFTWTGWDYIGEAGVGIPAYAFGEGGFGARFPAQLAYCGDLDITGFRRPASYFREIVFGLRRDPYITVQDPAHYGENVIKTPWVISDSHSSWTHPGFEGRPVIVEIYAPGDEVELFRNGTSLGRKPSGASVSYITYFETTYEPGTLRAVCYENGEKIGSMDLTTADGDGSLTLTAEEVTKNDVSLIFVDIAVKDDDGICCDAADQKIRAAVEGDAVILGFGSGNPKPEYNYVTEETETFYGKAQLILKRTGTNPITITVSSDADHLSVLQIK